MTQVSIHRPARGRAEHATGGESEGEQRFQSTAQHAAGRNLSRMSRLRVSNSFNPPPSTRPGGTVALAVYLPNSSVSIHRPARGRAERPSTWDFFAALAFQSTAQHAAGRNPSFAPGWGRSHVSIHRPARGRAEPCGRASLRPPLCFNPPPSTRPGGTVTNRRESRNTPGFNPPPSTRPGGTSVFPPQAPDTRPVSIHRPARGRAEHAGGPGCALRRVSIHRPARGRAEQFVVQARAGRLPAISLREPRAEVQLSGNSKLFSCHAARPTWTFTTLRTLPVFFVAPRSRYRIRGSLKSMYLSTPCASTNFSRGWRRR